MQNLDLLKFKKIFFVGIGGIGISAIAKMMLFQDKKVLGSDIAKNEMTNELEKLGAEIKLGQGIELIPKDIDLLVYSIAIPRYDPIFFENLKSLNIPLFSYPQMLGIITNEKYTIAVSGTHGKTTTTAMIAKILIDNKKDPSVIVGSLLKEFKSNLIIGESEYFVVEACEYERSFLNLKPKILVITNIEADHLDYYKDLDDIKNAFNQLEKQSEIVVKDYKKYLDKVPKLSVPGEHNRMNAAAALAVADILKINEVEAKASLEKFSGTWRRLENKGETQEGVIVYDDYAHHPTEIRSSLQALRDLYPKGEKRITVLFQPHLYSRTKALFDDFAQCFGEADKVLLLPIYFAREAKDESVSSEKLVEAICLAGKDASFVDFMEVEHVLKLLNLGKNDIFVTMGAGEAYKVADNFFKFI